jgi:hypothetical protein
MRSWVANSGRDVRRGIIALLLVSACVPAEADGTAAGSPDFPAGMRDTAALMLRLTDLGPGYTIGDDTGCGIGTEGLPENLAQAVITHLPESCSIEFEHFRVSPYVESSASTFHTPDGPATFFALRGEFLKASGIERATEHPQAGIGDEARLFLTEDAFIPGTSGSGRSGAVVLWRRGMTLATVLVAGPRQDRARRMALKLAARQDERIRAPAPIGPRDNDDLEVPLADPRLGVPVQWLGRRFAPGRDLPPLRLAYTSGPERPEDGLPGTRAQLEYDPRRLRTQGIVLDVWRPSQWRRVSRALSGRQLWRSPCTRTRRVSIADGHAVTYAGYARLPRSGNCPPRPRDSFAALAYFRRVVVAVNMPYCDRCADGDTGRSAPYNSVKGMSAAVRGLRLHRR